MLSLLNSGFIVNLLMMNLCLILAFIWLHKRYHLLSTLLETHTIVSKSLDEKQRKILHHYFSFYAKLSPDLKRIFEQKLLFFLNMKEYSGAEGFEIHPRVKLFISAYAAQVSLGFRNYGFSHIQRIQVYPGRFYCASRKQEVRWHLDDSGTLHLSWSDFFEQMKRKVVLPMGLEAMAYAIKKDENDIKDEIFSCRTLLYPQVSSGEGVIPGQPMFKAEDFQTSENFLEACIKNYFSDPMEMKNTCPGLFKRIDHLLYSQMRFMR